MTEYCSRTEWVGVLVGGQPVKVTAERLRDLLASESALVAARQEAQELRDRVDALTVALRPFADAGDGLATHEPRDIDGDEWPLTTMGGRAMYATEFKRAASIRATSTAPASPSLPVEPR